MNSTRLLTVVAVMQGLILAGQWLGSPSVLRSAEAQLPDSGAQRQQIVEELRTLNGKMDSLIGLLNSGQLQVKAVLPDENNKKPASAK